MDSLEGPHLPAGRGVASARLTERLGGKEFLIQPRTLGKVTTRRLE